MISNRTRQLFASGPWARMHPSQRWTVQNRLNRIAGRIEMRLGTAACLEILGDAKGGEYAAKARRARRHAERLSRLAFAYAHTHLPASAGHH